MNEAAWEAVRKIWDPLAPLVPQVLEREPEYGGGGSPMRWWLEQAKGDQEVLMLLAAAGKFRAARAFFRGLPSRVTARDRQVYEGYQRTWDLLVSHQFAIGGELAGRGFPDQL